MLHSLLDSTPRRKIGTKAIFSETDSAALQYYHYFCLTIYKEEGLILRPDTIYKSINI